ncbi:MAG: hypothetical protein OZ921_01260 [Sorangiineae bacterium]|nr:hypothetical protein [Polyangiaceae bacterium]MEB2321112.1 hypothetical protein [Sorangiineae bacterium]
MRVAPLLVGALLFAAGCREPAPTPGASQPGVLAQPPRRAAGEPKAPGISGETVRLTARHASGVPLHAAPGDSGVSARLADGTSARVLSRAQDGQWLEITTEAGERGWITRRYVAAETSPALPRAEPTSPSSPSSSAFRSRADCLRALGAGERLPRATGTARLGTWNLRWFPDGRPGTRPKEGQGQDLEWLACSIAWLGVDALAVQEIKRYPGARERAAELIARLDVHTKGAWQLRLDDCPNDAVQHVGILYDARKVRAGDFETYGALNPHGEACAGSLRPGFGAYLRWPRGLDLTFVSVHLKSGPGARDAELRRRSIASFGTVVDQIHANRRDADVVFAGDFNTMGCESCRPSLTSASEIDDLPLAAALHRVPAEGSCSEYYDGRGGLLDHFVVTSALRTLSRGGGARVSGFCAAAACESLPRRRMPEAYTELSDHCPLILDLDDRTRD